MSRGPAQAWVRGNFCRLKEVESAASDLKKGGGNKEEVQKRKKEGEIALPKGRGEGGS